MIEFKNKNEMIEQEMDKIVRLLMVIVIKFASQLFIPDKNLISCSHIAIPSAKLLSSIIKPINSILKRNYARFKS